MKDQLTRRELEVAALVAEGLSNREIADRLFISERTAEGHVENIRGKLGFRSRSQIAAWYAAASAETAGGGAGEAPLSAPAHTIRRGRVAIIALVGASAIAVAVVVGAIVLLTRPTPANSPVRISTIAGTGVKGMSADGPDATRAQLQRPVAVAVAADGSLVIIDGNRIRKISPSGAISTIAGAAEAGYGGDGGPATAALLNAPQGIAIDSHDNVFVADTLNSRVRRIDAGGTISTVAGSGVPGFGGDGGPAVQARLNAPVGVAIGYGGAVFIADSANNRVRLLSPSGEMTTAAGTGDAGYAGDGGPATAAPLDAPTGVAFDALGRLYIADSLNGRIRRVDIGGTITTLAGTGRAGYSGDGGPARQADLNLATGPLSGAGQPLSVDRAETLYVADALNNRIRTVDASGVIRTLAGDGSAGFSGDGGAATSGRLNLPLGVAIDADGNVYIADTENDRIRRVAAG